MLMVILGAAVFYWFGIREAHIRISCSNSATSNTEMEAIKAFPAWSQTDKNTEYEVAYDLCVHGRGL